MSFTPKQGNNAGSGTGSGQSNQQTAKEVLAGIQQQMQNLVHGQNVQNSQTASTNLNALMLQMRQQHQQHQQFESIIKQQQLYLSNPQLVQQFQQQIQQQQQNVTGVKEPLALTRTPAAADLLNKTLQQQANGSNATASSGPTAAAAAASSASAQQFQQQLQALPGNIMQQLQVYHHQIAQQQQQQYQSNRLPTQQSFQNQPNATTVSQPLQQQASQSQQHVSQYPQTNYQQQQKILAAAAAAVASKSPSTGVPLKPPNLPASTQITPIPSPSIVAAIQQQSNNFALNKNQAKPATSTSSIKSNNSQPATGVVSTGVTGSSTKTSTVSGGGGGVGVGAGVAGNVGVGRSTISPISAGASLHQKTVLGSQQNSVPNIKHQSVSTKLPPPTQITAVPLTKPTIATSSPAKANLPTNVQQPPKGASIPTATSQIVTGKIIPAGAPLPPAISTTLTPIPATTNTSAANISETAKANSQPTKAVVVPLQTKAQSAVTTDVSVPTPQLPPIVSSIATTTATTPSSLTITAVPAPKPSVPDILTIAASVPATDVVAIPTEKINEPPKKENAPQSKDLVAAAVAVSTEKAEPIPKIAAEIIPAPVDKIIDKKEPKPLKEETKNSDKNLVEIKKIDTKITEEKPEEPKNYPKEIQANKPEIVPEKPVVEKDAVPIDEDHTSSPTISNKPSEVNTDVKTDEATSAIENPDPKDSVTKPSIVNSIDSTDNVVEEVNKNTVDENISTSSKEKPVREKCVKEKSPVKQADSPTPQVPPSPGRTLKKKTASPDVVKSEKVEAKKKPKPASPVCKEPLRSRQSPKTPVASTSGTYCMAASDNSNDSDGRTKRHRLKTILYQSPLPELAFITKLSASEASNSPKPGQSNEDKLIVFYKNEFLAVRNADGGFFLCQTMQNVYKTSPKIRIRWLSEEKKDTSVYIPDFYDYTDIECVLTTVELGKVNKERLRLPNTEKERIENILKKAIDVEKGILPRPDVTEENPDGLDISLYKNESQIEKKSGRKRGASKSPKRIVPPRTATKSGKSKKSSSDKQLKPDDDDTDDDDQYDSDDETEDEYRPSQKKKNLLAQQSIKIRAQRSPLARARAASPLLMKSQEGTSGRPKITKMDDCKASTSRNDRAKRRATDTSFSIEEYNSSKKPSTSTASHSYNYKRGINKNVTSTKTRSSEDETEPLSSFITKDISNHNSRPSTSKAGLSSTFSANSGITAPTCTVTSTVTSATATITATVAAKKTSTVVASVPDKILAASNQPTTSTAGIGRPTRSRK